MNLCSKKHEEVCYESNECPVCFEIEQAKDVVADLEKQIKELENNQAE